MTEVLIVGISRAISWERRYRLHKVQPEGRSLWERERQSEATIALNQCVETTRSL